MHILTILRRPKDILCLIIFVVFCILMGAIAVYGESEVTVIVWVVCYYHYSPDVCID